MKKIITIALASAAVMTAAANPVDFDKIAHWAGKGPNRAALVVKFHKDQPAHVWGYRWENGEKPTGEDMFRAVCASSQELIMLTQYTGTYGSTLCGVGFGESEELISAITFDFDKALNSEYISFDYYMPNESFGQYNAPGDYAPEMAAKAIYNSDETHVIQHPFDHLTYGYPAYDYDCWIYEGDGGIWQSGWYEGYWSYWLSNTADADWEYSGFGFSERTLSDGDIDAWVFSPIEDPDLGGGDFGGDAEEPSSKPDEYDYRKDPKTSWLEDVTFDCVADDGTIYVHPRRIAGLLPVFTPADAATWNDISYVLTGNNSSDRNKLIASLYNVNYWMPQRVKFPELQGYRPGECTLTVTVNNGADGPGEPFVKKFRVVVTETDRTPLEGGYVDGTIILNEEWFGHTNGSLNYITPDNDIIYQAYERENPGMSFGATSQFGTIWAGKLIVVSKQAVDKGDPLPGGGRLVIADAASLKRIGSLDDLEWNGIKGDGRAVAGASPDKIYITSSSAVFIADISNPAAPVITGVVETPKAEGSEEVFSGQFGDIIRAGRYVYALRQKAGIAVIDPETDTAVAIIGDNNTEGVTQTGDGTVWYTTVDENNCTRFVAIDPETLEETGSYTFPAAIGKVQCSWGAWRSTAFNGSYGDNNIWFVTGSAGFMGGATGNYYRFNAEDDPEAIEPLFDISQLKGITGFGEEVAMATYGTPRFDPRHNRLIVMTGRKGASSGGYRDNWIHFADGTSGEITRTIQLEPYYWFQSLPIFPDKHDAVIDLDDISLHTDDDDLIVDLTDVVTDADNIDYNIAVSLLGNEGECASVSLDGRTLTVSPKATGTQTFTLAAESNGRTVSKDVKVNVSDITTGVSLTEAKGGISCDGTRITFCGMNGADIDIFDINGRRIMTIAVDEDYFTAVPGLAKGIYVLRASDGTAAKIAIE